MKRVQYTIIASDSEGTLEELLNVLKSLGSVGASRSIEIEGDRKKLYWDGDGSDKILSIEKRDLSDSNDQLTKSLNGTTYQKQNNVWRPID